MDASRRSRLLGLWSLVVYLFLYAPLVVLAAFSFNRERLTAQWRGFTLDWYARLLEHPGPDGAPQQPSRGGGGHPPRHRHRDRRRPRLSPPPLPPGRWRSTAFSTLPIVIPEIVMAASLLLLFAGVGLRLGFLSVVLAHVAFSVSYAVVVVRARLAGFDRSLEEAAMDLGGGAVADVPPSDAAGDRPRCPRRRAPRLRALDRRLRDHVVRGRRRLDDAAPPDLLDGEERHLAGDQRRFHRAPRGDRPPPLRRLAARAGGPGSARPRSPGSSASPSSGRRSSSSGPPPPRAASSTSSSGRATCPRRR